MNSSGNDCDVLIVGGGPAGSAAALYLLKQGLRPVIVERERFPRFHIGESLTGECGNCLRELGLEEYMSEAAYPIKYGVNVWGAGGKNSFWVPVKKKGADGKLYDTTTWQVVRSRFDDDLFRAAIDRGAGHVSGTAQDVIRDGNWVAGVVVSLSSGQTRELRAPVVLDASGQATFLANCGVTSPKQRGNYERQAAIFSQATGAIRDEGPSAGNTLIFYRSRNQWAWFIPLTDTVTSVGVVVPGDYYKSRQQSLEEFLRAEVLAINPQLTWRMREVEWIEPVRTASNYSYHVEHYTGPGYLCVGDSHRFIDPIFSFGVFFAMKEASFAAAAIRDYFDGKTAGQENPFALYEKWTEAGQQVIQDLIDCFWDYPLAFQHMAHRTHTDDIIDCFAGRVYQDRQSDGVLTMRRLLAKHRSRAA